MMHGCNYFIRILDIGYEFPFAQSEWVYGVAVSIPSCPEGDPGSIPGRPVQQFFPLIIVGNLTKIGTDLFEYALCFSIILQMAQRS